MKSISISKTLGIALIIILPIMHFNNVQARQKTVKIAMAQIFCLDGDRSGNFARIEGVMLIPYGWAAEENAWPEHSLALSQTVQNAAKTVGCPIIGTDLIGQINHGPWTGLVYGGASVVSDKNGNILANGKDRDREVLRVTIELLVVQGI